MILLPVLPLPAVQIEEAEPGHKHMGYLGMGMTGQVQVFPRGALMGTNAEGKGAMSVVF